MDCLRILYFCCNLDLLLLFGVGGLILCLRLARLVVAFVALAPKLFCCLVVFG